MSTLELEKGRRLGGRRCHVLVLKFLSNLMISQECQLALSSLSNLCHSLSL